MGMTPSPCARIPDNNFLITESKTISGIAQNTYFVTPYGSVSKQGYKALGIVGYGHLGNAERGLFQCEFLPANDAVYLGVVDRSNALVVGQTYSFTVYVLYKRLS